MKKIKFYPGSGGAPAGGDRRDLLFDAFLFMKQIFCWNLYFFHFGINIGFVIPKEEFWKSNVCRGIKLILQTWIWKIWLIWTSFSLFFLLSGTWLTLRTCCGHVTEQKMHKIWLAIWFCPWDFRTCPHPWDMSRTCSGHFQLSLHQKNFPLPITTTLCSSRDNSGNTTVLTNVLQQEQPS